MEDSSDNFEHNSIYIANIPPEITLGQLEKIFQNYGEILRFHIGNRKINKRFAIFTYSSVFEAKSALELNNNPPLYMNVRFAQNKSWNTNATKRDKKKKFANKFDVRSTRSPISKTFAAQNVNTSGNCLSPRENNVVKPDFEKDERVNFTSKFNNQNSPLPIGKTPVKNINTPEKSLSPTQETSIGNEREVLCNSLNHDESDLCEKFKKDLKIIIDRSKCKCAKVDLLPELPDKFILRMEDGNCKICGNDRLFITTFNFSTENNGCDCSDNHDDNSDERIVQQNSNHALSSINEKFSVVHLCSEESELDVRTVRKLSENNWLCEVVDKNTMPSYRQLCIEFLEDCNNALASFGKCAPTLGKIMAIQDTAKDWYRAVMLPDSSWALIDDGNVIKNSDIIAIILCPEKYLSYPIFCHTIIFELDVKIQLKFAYNFKLVARFPTVNKCFIQMQDDPKTFARIIVWDPLKEYYCNNTKNIL